MKKLFLGAILLTLSMLKLDGKQGCSKKHEENSTCAEPDIFVNTKWMYSVARQAFSIQHPDEFQADFELSVGQVIRENNQSVFENSYSSSTCANDRRGRKKKRKMMPHPKPFPKESLLKHALCEWIVEENVDLNRQPNSIMENKCKCRYTRKLKKNYLCESVQMYMNVLRRINCLDGVYRYTQVWEPYSIACIAIKLPSPTKLQRGKSAIASE